MTSPPDFELVHQDSALLVANKPAGLLAVPGRGADKQDCLSSRLQREFPDALVVHRLDMSTSGLMVFARGAGMQRRLSQMFQGREVKKHYVALVAGKLEPEAGEIDLPLGADWPNRPMQKVDAESGKPSLTRYRVLNCEESARAEHVEAPFTIRHPHFDISSDLPASEPGRMTGSFMRPGANGVIETTRVELEPVTGRTHQLRLHMSAIGHPILGDALYGDAAGARRLMLHATSLDLLHPFTGECLNFVSPAPF